MGTGCLDIVNNFTDYLNFNFFIMSKVIQEWQSLSCHWKFFINIKPQKGKKSVENTISQEKLDHHDYFHIFLKEVK